MKSFVLLGAVLVIGLCSIGIARGSSPKKVPPITCNSDEARDYMRPIVAKQLFIDPAEIASIATLGGAGGESGAHGKPNDQYYSSYMSCPIRVTVRTGGSRFMTFNERYSNAYGEEFQLTAPPFDSRDPLLKWVGTDFPQ